MPVVDKGLIAKAKALRAQGMTQEEIAVELSVPQTTILGGKLARRKKQRRSAARPADCE